MIKRIFSFFAAHSEWFLAYAMFCCAALIRYSGALRVGFLSDDFHWLFTAREQPWYVYPLRNIEGGIGGSSYGPLMNWWFDAWYTLFGMHAWAYHAASILLVSAVALLLYRFARMYGWSIYASAAVGVLFLAIPAHTEAVVWISAQTHLVATVFIGFSWYAWQKFFKSRQEWMYIVAIAAYAVSLFSKEIAILAPIAFGVALFFSPLCQLPEKLFERLKILILRMLPFVGVVVAYMLLRSYATAGVGYHANSVYFSFEMLLHISGMILSYTVGMFGIVSSRYAAHVFGVGHPLLVWSTIACFVVGSAVLFEIKKTLPHIIFAGVCVLPFLVLDMSAVNRGGERYIFLFSFALCLYGVFMLSQLRGFVGGSWRRGMTIAVVGVGISGLIFGRSDVLAWQKSTEVVKNIVEQVAEHTEEIPMVLFGLPDTIAGVEALRNGIFPAVSLRYGKSIQGERIPQYTVLSGVETEPVLVVHRMNSFVLLNSVTPDDDWIFTGFKEWSGVYTSSTFIDFLQPGFLGKAVRVDQFATANVWVWNGVQLVDISQTK